jgi:hypothetical protein
MGTELAVSELYDSCESSFAELLVSLKKPVRDFGDELSASFVKDERGRFRVWARSVGAHHCSTSRLSLEYRLRESKFYLGQNLRLLKGLERSLTNGKNVSSGVRSTANVRAAIALLRNERLPIEECESPPESASEAEISEAEPESETESKEEIVPGSVSSSNLSRLAALKLFNGFSGQNSSDISSSVNNSNSITEDGSDTDSISEYQETEISQVREQIQDQVSQLFKISMIIRNPKKHDRYARCSSTNVTYYESFDKAHIQECFPIASEVLLQRLARAMVWRRKYLIHNQMRDEKRAGPRRESQQGGQIPATPPEQQPDQFAENLTRNQSNHTSTLKSLQKDQHNLGTNTQSHRSTEPTKFIPPNESDDNDSRRGHSDLGSISTYASTRGSGEKVRIPSRPLNSEGNEQEQFQCPYCCYPIEIRSNREWK